VDVLPRLVTRCFAVMESEGISDRPADEMFVNEKG
jgi:hypothetical protein